MRIASVIAKLVSALSIDMAASRPLVLAESACWRKSPWVVPAEAEGVPMKEIALTVPARSDVTARFSVPAKVRSVSVVAVRVPLKVALSVTVSTPAPSMTMLPLPAVARVKSPEVEVTVRAPVPVSEAMAWRAPVLEIRWVPAPAPVLMPLSLTCSMAVIPP